MRSVRQLRLEINETGTPTASDQRVVKSSLPSLDARDDQEAVESPESAALGLMRTAPPLEGMAALRNMFIKKFVDNGNQAAAFRGKTTRLSIIV